VNSPAAFERSAQGGTVERSRAADDFEVIRERLEELRREREEISSTNTPGETAADEAEAEAEQRRQECCEGAPPSWVPTIFLPQPTD
jgi:hypothetical protein